jgi:formate hydrogenlyase subunit 6/NADH:ubiquinone oxidoreductase subunit I
MGVKTGDPVGPSEAAPVGYRPSTVRGKPDVPPRGRITPWNVLAAIAEGAWTIVVGHWVTLKNFGRKKVTDQYPHRDQRRDWQPRPGYRGDFALITNKEAGRLRCTACMACANICPAGCIWIEGEGKAKERVAVQFFIDAGLCMYCWFCVETCPFGAITMTPDYETAANSADKLLRDIDYLRTRGLEYDAVLRPIEVEAPPEETTDAPAAPEASP